MQARMVDMDPPLKNEVNPELDFVPLEGMGTPYRPSEVKTLREWGEMEEQLIKENQGQPWRLQQEGGPSGWDLAGSSLTI